MNTPDEIKTMVAEESAYAIMELRDTLKPTFDANGLGYKSADDARLQITKSIDRKLNNLMAELLKAEKRQAK